MSESIRTQPEPRGTETTRTEANETGTRHTSRRTSVLSVRDLQVHYETPHGAVKAVNRVSFELAKGEILGLVGESGSGKTTMAMALVGLIRPPAHIAGGEILLDGRNLAGISRREYNRVRLSEISLMPQGAMNSLNPVTRIREQLLDGLRDHGVTMPRGRVNLFLGELLERVGLRPEVANMYPHELSGGMKQRVAMAIAISMRPKVIIADEPTSALDVVVQKRLMQTLRDVQSELDAAIILVGHDMGLMAQTVDRLGVMYAGRLVEIAPMTEALLAPQHPYTRLLIESLPSVTQKKDLRGIPGLAPHLLDLPGGCPFHPRCPHMFEQCQTEMPQYREVKPNHWAACHLSEAEQLAAIAAVQAEHTQSPAGNAEGTAA